MTDHKSKMDGSRDSQLEQLIDGIVASAKYRSVNKDLIKAIGSKELVKRRNLKDAIKSTRNKLHQIGGAYLEYKPQYRKWEEALTRSCRSGSKEDLLKVCTEIMQHHASTRERLPILNIFYQEIFADLTPVRSVLDVACGLNPIAIPWMPLSDETRYYAIDIYQDMVDFINKFLSLMKIEGKAETGDVIQGIPGQKVDAAFVLKAIPCLEQIDKSIGSRLLDSIPAEHILVSFPVRSLGGRDKGMIATYESKFKEMVSEAKWTVKRFEFATELVFRISK